MRYMSLCRIIGAFNMTPIEIQKKAVILFCKHRLKYMAARKAARLVLFEYKPSKTTHEAIDTSVINREVDIV